MQKFSSTRGAAYSVATALLGGLMVDPHVVVAQTQKESPVLQEITVTAQKYKQDEEKVPISLTAISGRNLAEQGIHDFQEVLTQVPDLSFEYGTGSSTQGMSASRGITIRGISGANTTSFYINDTPVPVSVDPRLLDVDRIEVLKGPQGTLYGAASMGGEVRVITQTPNAVPSTDLTVDGHQLDGAGAGTFDSVNSNVPIDGDTAAMRVGAFYSYEPGFLNRTYDDPGAINGQFVSGPPVTVHHVGTQNSGGALLNLLLKPSSGLSISPMILVQRTTSDGFLAADDSADNPVQRRALNVPEGWADTFYLLALDIRYDTPLGRLVSDSSYFYRNAYDKEDGSDVTQQLFSLATVTPVTSWSDLYTKQFTQEFRLESQINSRLQTIAGIYFNDPLVTYDQTIAAPGANAASGGTLGTDLGYLSNQPVRTLETAAYLSATYNLVANLNLLGGVRVSKLSIRSANQSMGFYNGGTSASSLKYDANAVSPRVGLQYQISDSDMVYTTASKGFRPGGPQFLPGICGADAAAVGLPSGDSFYRSDSLWNYEVGAKTRWLDRRILANVAVYDMEWSGIQQSVRLPTCGFNAVVNGAQARSSGAETELDLAPVTGLTVGLAAGYEDARITGVAADSGSLYVGQPLNGVPKWTSAANLEYEFTAGRLGRMFVNAAYNYVGPSVSLNNSPVTGRIRPGYGLVDFRLGTTIRDSEVSLYVKNLTNIRPNLGDEVSEIVETFGRPRYVVGPPRTVGVELRKSF